jgi:hypothetical protein
MFWDIAIVAGIALSQLFVTIYAVWVSVTENKIKIAFVIGVIGALGIALTVWGAIRSGTAQAALQSQLDKIENNTKNPPSVTVNPQINVPAPVVPAPKADLVLDSFISAYTSKSDNSPIMFIVGKPAELDFNFRNVGNGRADEIWNAGKIFLATTETEKELTDTFKTETAKELRNPQIRAHMEHGIMEPGGGEDSKMWFTVRSNRNVTTDDVAKLTDGSETLYFFVSLSYHDPQGSHYIHKCEFLQPLRPNEPKQDPIWHFCKDFSDRK